MSTGSEPQWMTVFQQPVHAVAVCIQQVNESMVSHTVSVCYPRDHSVTYCYNDPVVRQAWAVRPLCSDSLHGSSSAYSFFSSMHSNTVAHAHTCIQNEIGAQSPTYLNIKHFEHKFNLTCWQWGSAHVLTVCTGSQCQGDNCDAQQTRHFYFFFFFFFFTQRALFK